MTIMSTICTKRSRQIAVFNTFSTTWRVSFEVISLVYVANEIDGEER